MHCGCPYFQRWSLMEGTFIVISAAWLLLVVVFFGERNLWQCSITELATAGYPVPWLSVSMQFPFNFGRAARAVTSPVT